MVTMDEITTTTAIHRSSFTVTTDVLEGLDRQVRPIVLRKLFQPVTESESTPDLDPYPGPGDICVPRHTERTSFSADGVKEIVESLEEYKYLEDPHSGTLPASAAVVPRTLNGWRRYRLQISTNRFSLAKSLCAVECIQFTQ